MDQMLSAVYEHGSLRLLEPVDLAESSQVQVQILAPEGDLQTVAFRRLLASMRQLLDNAEEAGATELVRATVLRMLRDDLQLLWKLSQEPQSDLCSLLQLALARLQPAQATRTQLAVIRSTLDLLAEPTLNEADVHASHEHFIAAGFPPAFSLDDEAIQSYVDEL